MRFRLGVILGFAGGYYLGAKAGRERYEHLRSMLGKIRRSDAVETMTDKAKAAVELGVERTEQLVKDHRPGGNRPNGRISAQATMI